MHRITSYAWIFVGMTLLYNHGALAQNDGGDTIENAVPCAQTARQLDGKPGTTITVLCPSSCKGPLAWGTDIYADDSAVCIAAQHAGVYDGKREARVQVHFLPGEDHYTGSTQHGITTYNWGAWNRSFSVESASSSGTRQRSVTPSTAHMSASAPPSSDPAANETISCATRGEDLQGLKGSQHTVQCPANCKKSPVWGSGPYTDDSSVCAAAIHAGVIDDASGGSVTITIEDAIRNAKGSKQNGIKSQPWKYWNRSFRIEKK